MREISPTLTKELSEHIGNNPVASSAPYEVCTYRQLVEQIAKLSYLNKDNLLFFRGQKNDYLNKAESTTLYPSIYRGDYLTHEELTYRFRYLDAAGKILCNQFKINNIDGTKDLERKRHIQWSILQHYEVCETPLLDITQSLRVACTFSLMDNPNSFGHVYVLGLPYLTNRITYNSEHDIINIRLLSICPPEALRPYFQEGFLAGTTDITTNFENKNELDFKNRLIAKFKISTLVQYFLGDEFKLLPRSAIYPYDDRVDKICKRVKKEVNISLNPGEIGEFLEKWSEIETMLLEKTKQYRKSNTISNALKIMQKQQLLDHDIITQIYKIKRLRNEVVHSPKNLRKTLIGYFNILDSIINELKQL